MNISNELVQVKISDIQYELVRVQVHKIDLRVNYIAQNTTNCN